MELQARRRDELLERASTMVWFHAIDFGGVRSAGRFPEDQPQNCTLYGVMDLMKHIDFNGLDCADVGAANGLLSFHMKSCGAKRVVATNATVASPGLSIASELLGIEVDLVSSATFANILEKLPLHSFDVLICAGVLYHMLNPFDCILEARRLLKRDGLLILETAYDSAVEAPTIHFNSASGKLQEIFTYWIPSKSAVLGMLRLAGFDVLAIRAINAPGRIAVIGETLSRIK